MIHATNLFHFGVLVHDIDAAIERFSDVLGLNFNPPTTLYANLSEEGEVYLRGTYSREGPPHLELLEATGDGVFSRAHGEGFHHVGLYVPDMAASLETNIGKLGVEADERFLNEDGGTRTWYSKPSSTHGIRLEFVDIARRELIEKWISGESDTL